MPDLSQTVGIVLAGGRSSRMGRDKARLEFKGRPLVQHMMDILRAAGLKDIYISGSVEGYPCIPDEQPFAGPAGGINNFLRKKPGYRGYLFVPVDMPLLSAEILGALLAQDDGGYFISRPLPLFLRQPITSGESGSVRGIIEKNHLYPLDMPPAFEAAMMNVNTPQDWEKALAAA